MAQEFPLESSFLLGLAGIISAFLLSVLNYFLRSRCENITCCWGLAGCTRSPLPPEAIEAMDATRRDSVPGASSTNVRLENVRVVR